MTKIKVNKMIKINSKNYEEMSKKYFETNSEELAEAIKKYQKSCIYKECIKNLRFNSRLFSNLFEACSHYSNIAVNDCEVGQQTYEIGSFITKSGNPEIVYF